VPPFLPHDRRFARKTANRKENEKLRWTCAEEDKAATAFSSLRVVAKRVGNALDLPQRVRKERRAFPPRDGREGWGRLSRTARGKKKRAAAPGRSFGGRKGEKKKEPRIPPETRGSTSNNVFRGGETDGSSSRGASGPDEIQGRRKENSKFQKLLRPRRQRRFNGRRFTFNPRA